MNYYKLTTKIKDTLLNDVNVNTVTKGDIFDIDLTKKTIYPLSHLQVDNVTFTDNTVTYSISVFCMDILDKSKEHTVDNFRGNNNEDDVLNTQLAVAMRLVKEMTSGTLLGELFHLEGEPTCEPFTERFEHDLAGWALNLNVVIPNGMLSC